MAANAPSGSLVFFARLRLSALRALPQPCCDSRSSAGVLFLSAAVCGGRAVQHSRGPHRGVHYLARSRDPLASCAAGALLTRQPHDCDACTAAHLVVARKKNVRFHGFAEVP